MNFKVLIGAIIGGGAGFVLGYFGKCTTGVCPLTRNPYISTIIGIILGVIFTLK